MSELRVIRQAQLLAGRIKGDTPPAEVPPAGGVVLS